MEALDPESFGTMEEELAAYHAQGWRLEEAFWPGEEKPKYHIHAPNGEHVFNAQELVDGCFHECDEVTEWSSDERRLAHWIAGRLYILQRSYKNKYHDYFNVERATPEQWEQSKIHWWK